MNTDIEKLTTDLATRAAGILVTDQASANRATELILAGKGMIRKIKDFYELRKAKAHELWRFECDEEKADLAKIEPIVNALNAGVSNWRAEEARKYLAAEAERARIENERKRIEEETLRKAREADEKAERERRRLELEAEEINRKAAKKTNDEAALKRIDEERERLRIRAEESRRIADEETTLAIDEGAAAESALPPAPAVPEAPKTEGLAMRDNFSFEVTDKVALPEEFKIADQIALNAMARIKKEGFKIPGGRVINKPSMTSISAKGK
jgi:hypothetical protein